MYQSVVPNDHPEMKAWKRYVASPQYDNSYKWAVREEHRQGSMWAAFDEGWRAAMDYEHSDRAEVAPERVQPPGLEGREAMNEYQFSYTSKARYEYRIAHIASYMDVSHEINGYARDGWRLVAVRDETYYFERELPAFPDVSSPLTVTTDPGFVPKG